MSEDDLSPCPFCGGSAHFERLGTPRQSCIVECDSCGARHESGDEGASCGNSWNHRATQPADATEAPSDSMRDALTAIMRAADAAKEPCGMDPESPAAIRNGKFATIAQLAAQGLGLVRGPSLAAPAASGMTDAARDVLAAAADWGVCERDINDWAEANLAKALARHFGDWEGCPDCDHATCDEPCTPTTVEEQIAAIDGHMAQLVHEGKLRAPNGYKPPAGWKPIEVRRSRSGGAA